ncbi:nicotinamide-nucleotide adenylyltransferase, putative [Entamoeba dispar SAW760]|uniref:Nicotinamide-nucleotide adenylyltransferase n=1 Tax=Entamoeba dispar (strain ATCC PRA-260 / SAW760) TaxID=370354 RepID=B0EAI2_ENTDS|nr:nicotinamide-nucleotide adenylyltransferase, putative [Entamoeba dispar SAW760]EDR28454.1 nicotinamide-nucleotide adenylyltransferase, putative [Entamoeba dispar SAW760]|eukprot:EDR28454.1 nicotinamide-nucleotide adenylyltransferase, putative [Entamoeba dispar SAW760]
MEEKNIILVCCGSYNPIHYIHLLLFELTKNYFKEHGRNVVKGIISPANDLYWKKGLLSSKHRVAMCQEAVKTSDWIIVDDWESTQKEYVRTYNVLAHEREVYGNDYDIYFIGADDLIPNMMNKNCWDQVLLEKIVNEFGIVFFKRINPNCSEQIKSYPLFARHLNHIFIIQSFQSQHSSTLVRQLVKSGMSIKYLVPDSVINYITEHQLYLE